MSDYSLKHTVLQILVVPMAVLKRFSSDRLPRHAAALAFSSLLALAPMMAIVLSMFSLFASFEQMSTVVLDFFYKFLAPSAGDELRVYLEQFAGRAGQLTLVGLIFFLLTALLMLANIESSFNDIWRVNQGRTLGHKLAVYWALVSLGPILMGASLTVSTYVLGLSFLNGEVASFGLFLLPSLLEIAAFFLLYFIMPNVRVSVLHALVGALVAAGLFELSKRAFVYYVSSFANYEVVYGALSTLPIFLIWVYLCWLIALCGAAVVAELQEKHLLELQGDREHAQVNE